MVTLYFYRPSNILINADCKLNLRDTHWFNFNNVNGNPCSITFNTLKFKYIHSSLLESKSVIIFNQLDLYLPINLTKKRVFSKEDQFIFFNPRATYYFKNYSDKIMFNSFSELYKDVSHWN